MAKTKKDTGSSRQDVKKKAQAMANSKVNTKKKEKRSLKEYFKGVRLEMKKVVWPTKKELGSYTVVVVAACAFFALAFWGIDSGFLAILKSLLGISL
ncbi:MAG: preprotein translocase subunit SecE [Eubacteriaceae bacterium]|nr:preprotein translocase subunit SecE [Eubacteriaceae bacterium]